MRKQVESLMAYLKPECHVAEAATERFICVSVRPNSGASTTQTNYDDKGEHDVGTIYLGDPSTIAPAKQGWFEEEEED